MYDPLDPEAATKSPDPYKPPKLQGKAPKALSPVKESPLGKISNPPALSRFAGQPRAALPKNWMPQAVRQLARNLNRNLISGVVKTV